MFRTFWNRDKTRKLTEHIYAPDKDDGILETTFATEPYLEIAKHYINPIANFKKWFCCKGKKCPNQSLGYLLGEWMNEKKEQLHCKNKDGQCNVGKLAHLNKSYRRCNSCKKFDRK